MHSTIPHTGPRALDDIAGAARARLCPLCWAAPGRPCTITGPPGDHFGRYQDAERSGAITRAELAAVVAGLEVIAPLVITRAGAR